MSLTDRAAYWADKFDVDPSLFTSLVQQESAFNPRAVNPSTGAFGLTQAMPATAASPGFGVAPLERTAGADDQLRFGAQYFGTMMDRYDDDAAKALAAYNWGPGNADKWNGNMDRLPEETSDYISKILGRVPQTVDMPEEETAPEEPPTGLAALMPRRSVGKGDDRHTEYGDNMLGRAAQKVDGFRSSLGLGEGMGEVPGKVLQGIGMQMMGL